MVNLEGRVHVVAGGTGRAGEPVVKALLARGATVVVPSRSADRLAALRERNESERLHGYLGDISDLSRGTGLRDRIVAEVGAIDAVVAALGGWWEGTPLAELDVGTWQKILTDNLTSHFLTARIFLPVLADRPDAVYLTLGGIASVLAVAGSGPISITGAGQAMMMRVLAKEMADRAVRLHEVDIFTPVVTDRWDGGPIEPGWLSGDEMGAFVADALDPGFAQVHKLFLSVPDDGSRAAAQAELDDLT